MGCGRSKHTTIQKQSPTEPRELAHRIGAPPERDPAPAVPIEAPGAITQPPSASKPPEEEPSSPAGPNSNIQTGVSHGQPTTATATGTGGTQNGSSTPMQTENNKTTAPSEAATTTVNGETTASAPHRSSAGVSLDTYGDGTPLPATQRGLIIPTSNISDGKGGEIEVVDFCTNDWDPGRQLGKGAFGQVHLATNKTGQMVAVKTISFEEDDPYVIRNLQLLHREIKTLRKVGQHRNVVRYFKSTRTQTQVHMWMEFCPGGSLKSQYQKSGSIQTQAALFTRDILCGLQFLHDQNIVHRDIKCDNVLLDYYGVAKLADFGAAVTLHPEHSQKTTIGTVYWMAPEVLQGKGHRTAADIWSLGCTVMEMMSGRRPFHGTTATTAQHLVFLTGEEPVLTPHTITDPNAQDFIHACLIRDPYTRPTCATLLEHPFVKDLVDDRPLPLGIVSTGQTNGQTDS